MEGKILTEHVKLNGPGFGVETAAVNLMYGILKIEI
jgi:hypothetical protein